MKIYIKDIFPIIGTWKIVKFNLKIFLTSLGHKVNLLYISKYVLLELITTLEFYEELFNKILNKNRKLKHILTVVLFWLFFFCLGQCFNY